MTTTSIRHMQQRHDIFERVVRKLSMNVTDDAEARQNESEDLLN